MAVFRHEHHPRPGGRSCCRSAHQEPMGVAPASRGWSLCCAGHRGKWTWPWRHANPVPHRGVHACHGRRSRLAAATDCVADLVRQDRRGRQAGRTARQRPVSQTDALLDLPIKARPRVPRRAAAPQPRWRGLALTRAEVPRRGARRSPRVLRCDAVRLRITALRHRRPESPSSRRVSSCQFTASFMRSLGSLSSLPAPTTTVVNGLSATTTGRPVCSCKC